MKQDEWHRILCADSENEHLECKKAENNFDFKNQNGLLDYVVALANEGGGKLILGVTDKKPRTVIGTKAFQDTGRTSNSIYQELKHKVRIEEYFDNGKRILIVHIPSRPIGKPLKYGGKARMRTGEGIRDMTDEEIARIYHENYPDFSAEVCDQLMFKDLDTMALKRLKKLWHEKSNNKAVLQYSDHKMLQDLQLEEFGRFTYTALILLGTKSALARYLGCAEIIFEYRSREENEEYQDRVDFREPFLLYFDKLWEKINARNEIFHSQEGFSMREIRAFNEEVIREAILNAIAHRDYKHPSSIFIKQSPTKIIIENPGGFLSGITPENIFNVPSTPRNRRLSETFQRIYRFVDRSGQGADKIFRKTIEEGKGIPDYSGSIGNWVKLGLNGLILDKAFLKYLKRATKNLNISFSIEELILLENIRVSRVKKITKDQVRKLLDLGVVESIGNTSGRKYILSVKYYKYTDRLGLHTKARGLRGLGRETIKKLILEHISVNTKGYMKEFVDAFPDITQQNISNILQELKRDGKIHFYGNKTDGHWVCKSN